MTVEAYQQAQVQPAGSAPFTVQQLMPYHTLSILLHAASKTGKSTLAATAPKPILALDVEGSWKFLPIRMTHWNPMQGPPPAYDGSWDACVVNVYDWSVVEQVSRYLTQMPTAFVTIVVDSITELQRRCKQNLRGSEAMKIQDWGTLLSVMDATIRGFRDLANADWSPIQCAVFVAESRMKDGKMVPYMQGQIEVALPYWMDLVAFYEPNWLLDANNQPTQEVRNFIIGPNSHAEAGERVQGRLGHNIPIPKPAIGQLPYPGILEMLYVVYGIPLPNQNGGPQ